MSQLGAGLQRGVQRLLDAAVSASVLLGASPLLVVAAACVWLEDRGPILFVQERAGKDGRIFRVRKVRTMRVNDRPPNDMGTVTSRHELVTRVGAWLRRLKIDELPQLWNVLVGDMSLVGPRPTLAEQVALYDAYRRRRLEVRPGLSGWAQVNGNTALPWDERIALDVWYIDNWSISLDLLILVKTVAVVLGGERINPAAVEEAKRHARRTGWSS